MFSEFAQHSVGQKSLSGTEKGPERRPMVSPTAVCLFAATKTDFLRCREKERQAIVAAILCEHTIFL